MNKTDYNTKYHEQHKTMEVWKSIEQLNEIVNEVLSCIPETEFKTRSQIINANDSIGSNFVEGYYAGYTKEYIRFLTYSRRSAGELHTRIELVWKRGMIGDILFNKFNDRSIKTMYLIDRTRQGLEQYSKKD